MPTGEATARLWRDPRYRRHQVEQLLKLAADPEVREKLAAAKRANWADPAYRARQGAAISRGKAASHRRVVDLP